VSKPQNFTDQSGRTFQYVQGTRVYFDGGKDIGTPVPYPPKYYPDELPPAPTASLSPSPGLLLEMRRLSRLLEKRLGVRVPVTTLLLCENLLQLENAVMILLPEPGKTHEERRALGRRIADLGVFCHAWTRHDIICDFVCLKCHRRLGAKALRLAKEEHNRRLCSAHARFPGTLINLAPGPAAICAYCGKSYAYADGAVIPTD
jgi:hypothetical protein